VPITVLTDAEPALPTLVRVATGQAVTHILDWWHNSMRVRHIETAVQGLIATTPSYGEIRRLASGIRWLIWHAQPSAAIGRIVEIENLCSAHQRFGPRACVTATDRVRNRCAALKSSLVGSFDSRVDYGARHRKGLPISASRAEGCVDDIANARMGKRRRMRWSPRGAHRVAVTRAASLDGRLTISHRTLAE